MGFNDALLNMFEKTQEQYALPHSRDGTGQCEFHYIYLVCV